MVKIQTQYVPPQDVQLVYGIEINVWIAMPWEARCELLRNIIRDLQLELAAGYEEKAALLEKLRKASGEMQCLQMQHDKLAHAAGQFKVSPVEDITLPKAQREVRRLDSI